MWCTTCRWLIDGIKMAQFGPNDIPHRQSTWGKAELRGREHSAAARAHHARLVVVSATVVNTSVRALWRAFVRRATGAAASCRGGGDGGVGRVRELLSLYRYGCTCLDEHESLRSTCRGKTVRQNCTRLAGRNQLLLDTYRMLMVVSVAAHSFRRVVEHRVEKLASLA